MLTWKQVSNIPQKHQGFLGDIPCFQLTRIKESEFELIPLLPDTSPSYCSFTEGKEKAEEELQEWITKTGLQPKQPMTEKITRLFTAIEAHRSGIMPPGNNIQVRRDVQRINELRKSYINREGCGASVMAWIVFAEEVL